MVDDYRADKQRQIIDVPPGLEQERADIQHKEGGEVGNKPPRQVLGEEDSGQEKKKKL